MDPTTVIYGLLAAAGLIGADAYFSSDTIYLQISVAPAYEQRGFNHDLVEAILANELRDITDTQSIASDLKIVTSKDRPLSNTVADVVGLNEALQSAKARAGIDETLLVIGIVADSSDKASVPRIIITGNKIRKKPISLALPLASDTSIDAALYDAALLTMAEVDPYITALYYFERANGSGERPLSALNLIADRLNYTSASNFSSERALFENLNGVSYLLTNDITAADHWFDKALTSNPQLPLASLNRAFTELLQGNHNHAIELAQPFVDYDSIGQDDNALIVYAANIILGQAYSGLGDFGSADECFENAISIRPEEPGGYFYWARSLLNRGQMEEAQSAYQTAEQNASKTKRHVELAALSFWLPTEANGPLVPRTNILPGLQEPESP